MIHAIVTTWAFDKAKTREVSLRRCPKCRGEQIAADEKINEAVVCEECGAEIPPILTAEQKVTRADSE